MARFFLFGVFLILGLAFPTAPVSALDTNPFERGWTLDKSASELRFISLKRGYIAETNHFAELSGVIDESGDALVRVLLNSVETYVDIRNVRLRFLFFETYRHPMAEIRVRIDRGSLNDLTEVKRKIVPMEYTLSMHGEEVTRTERLTLFLIDENRVSVSNTDPIFVGVSDFDLFDGLQRLEDSASVEISPLAIVSFHFTFTRNPEEEDSKLPVPQTEAVSVEAAAARIAVWNAKDPDEQTCLARILTLGRLDSVRFEPLSARIADNSMPLIEAYADALVRCPSVRVRIDGLVARGEDNSGTLAQQRAQAISRTLWARGVQRSRLSTQAGGRVTTSTEPVGGGRAHITALN